MTKTSFLKKLGEALSTLSEEEKNNILEKYERLIEEEIKKGRKQRDIIQGLGDINLIARLYVENNDQDEIKRPYNTTKVVDSIITYMDGLFEHIDGIKAKLILEIICFSSIGLLILSLIGIPFQIVHFLLHVTIYFVSNNYYLYQGLKLLLSLSLLVLYIFTVIWFVVDYIKNVIQYIKHKYEL